MIKFRMSRDGKSEIVGFGLSEENLKRLREKHPILVDLRELNIPYAIQIMVFYGETEANMVQELQDLGVLTSETIVHVAPLEQ